MEQIENALISGEENIMDKKLANINEKEHFTEINNNAYIQIVECLKADKINHFNTLKTPSERIEFIYKNEAFKPLTQVGL